MATVNRYTTPREGLVVAPLSLEDYTRAGTIKAQTAGNLAEFANTQDLSYDVDVKDYDIVSQKVAALEGGISSISDAVTKGDISTSTIDDTLELKRSKNQLFGKNGEVTKAQNNKKTKDQWELDVQKYAIEKGLTTHEMNTILQKGNDKFSGTFNQDGSFNTFQPEFGPGHVNIPEAARERFDQIKDNMTESELKDFTENYTIDYNDEYGGFFLTNKKSGEVSTNFPALQAGLDAMNKEVDDPTSLWGSHVDYYGLDKPTVKNELKDIMKSFMRKERTNPTDNTTFVRTKALDKNKGDGDTPPPGGNSSLGRDRVKSYEKGVVSKSDFDKDEGVYTNTAQLRDNLNDNKTEFGDADWSGNPYANVFKSIWNSTLGSEKVQIGVNENNLVQSGNGLMVPEPVYATEADEFAFNAAKEMTDPYMVSFLENDEYTDPSTGEKVGFPSDIKTKPSDFDYEITTTDGGKITMLNNKAISDYSEEVEDWLTADRQFSYTPIISYTQGDRIVRGNKNEASVQAQKNGATAQSEFKEFQTQAFVEGEDTMAIFDEDGKEVTGDDRDAVVSAKRGVMIGETAVDGRFMLDENGEPDRRRLGMKLVAVEDDDGNKTLYYVQNKEDDQALALGGDPDYTEKRYNLEESLAGTDYIYGTPMVIRTDFRNPPEMPEGETYEPTATNGTYDVVKVAKATEKEMQDAPAGYKTGFVALIPDGNGSIIRTALSDRELRDSLGIKNPNILELDYNRKRSLSRSVNIIK